MQTLRDPLRFLAYILLAGYTIPHAVAQFQNGQITGLVTDPMGAVIAHAEVAVLNLDTGLNLRLATNDAGFYLAPELPIGRYRITGSSSGFKTATGEVMLHAGDSVRMNLTLVIGSIRETVEVTTLAVLNSENIHVTERIDSREFENLPLNGRNVFNLIQYSPGATNVHGVIFEPGASTVFNGVRENFNGFLVNGVPDTGLSGGYVNRPILDSIQEVQVLTLNNSAEFGSNAGGITAVVTKTGTNSWHGSGWEFFRNDALDANDFFANHTPDPADRMRPPLRLNQFGATLGGPIIRDKIFLFAAYQGERFLTSGSFPVQVESQQFRTAVRSAFPGSVAALLYSTFTAPGPTSQVITLRDYVNRAYSPSGFASFADYLCPSSTDGTGVISARFALLVGVEQGDIDQMSATCPGGSPFASPLAGAFRRDDALLVNVPFVARSQSDEDLFDGNESSVRLDYVANGSNRFFGQFSWARSRDRFTGLSPRGFGIPGALTTPALQLNFVHSFTSNLLNEIRAGYDLNSSVNSANAPGVPAIGFGDGTVGFGAYNGYPQSFRENIYHYSDLVAVSHSRHVLKTGIDVQRGMENSEVNSGRPSYYFFDPLFFAIDQPIVEVAGVDPAFLTGGVAHLEGNARHFRNIQLGAYLQDNWRVQRNFSLEWGLRYDLYTRPVELSGLGTTFVLGPGRSLIDNISTGTGQIKGANTPCPGDPLATLAGECGPGGFAPAKSLGSGDHNNFGPHFGFTWDPWKSGKNLLRGGFGIAYQGTLFNALSDSRWNPPYYSFDQVEAGFLVPGNNIVYGPVGGGTPTFSGPAPTEQHSGTGVQATGNISGWDPANPHLSLFTAIALHRDLRDPYVENWFLGLQHELQRDLILEVNYVSTAGRKLLRAEDVNRIPGARLPEGTCVFDNFARKLCSEVNTNEAPNGDFINFTGWLNPNFGHLRVWENAASSTYHGMQVSLRQQAKRGLQLRANYTYGHAIDSGSSWHNGATSANGLAAGDAFTTDLTKPGLDRGNSTFDVRHRFSLVYAWELPKVRSGARLFSVILSGWQTSGIWSFQSGAHWTPFHGGSFARSDLRGTCDPQDFDPAHCVNIGGDYNLDGEANDRPSALASHVDASHTQWADGFQLPSDFFFAPCLGCSGNLGRNTFVGPNFWAGDISVARSFRIRETLSARIRADVFNVFNHTNFLIGNNHTNDPFFGQAGGTANPRTIQVALQLTY